MPITLAVIEGPHQGQAFSFQHHDNFIVGRSVRAHFRLAEKDKYVSRFHFMVEVNPPLCRLLDLDSHNGTYVNSVRVQSHELQHGDRIKAGRTVLEVVMEAELQDADGPEALTGEPAAPPSTPPVQSVPAEGVEAANVEPCPAIPGYRVVRRLGKGAMGEVYLAVRESDGSSVALKTLRLSLVPTPAQLGRFLREVEILRELDHPHIVAFREFGQAGGLPYFVMDYVPGTDAKQFLKDRGALPVTMAVRLVCQALKGVEYAHQRGFVHRDLKPSNLLIAEVDGKWLVKVADFGLARVYHASELSGLTLTGEVGGTPGFMPPEQVTNYREARPPADQYAMAATLYMLLTNQRLFDARSHQEFYQLVLTQDPVPLRERRLEVPEGLAAVIQRALQKDPARRFTDVTEFRTALKAFG